MGFSSEGVNKLMTEYFSKRDQQICLALVAESDIYCRSFTNLAHPAACESKCFVPCTKKRTSLTVTQSLALSVLLCDDTLRYTAMGFVKRKWRTTPLVWRRCWDTSSVTKRSRTCEVWFVIIELPFRKKNNVQFCTLVAMLLM